MEIAYTLMMRHLHTSQKGNYYQRLSIPVMNAGRCLMRLTKMIQNGWSVMLRPDYDNAGYPRVDNDLPRYLTNNNKDLMNYD